ncbi:MAG TPA: DinB family protein [Gemmatimonadaceae bacterium]|nr:DinB family protein [Gemmatimonadaceae bacterium]
MHDLISDFRATVESAAERMRGMDEGESRKRRAPGAWSRKQIVGHLVDSAANNHARFVRAQLEPEHLDFPGYEQDGWVAAQRYEAEPWAQLVELWRLYNLHIAHVMSGASAEVLGRRRARHSLDRIAWQLVPRDEPATLEYFMRDYVGHLKHHLAQIFADSR